jgi:hypothetical protein
MKLFKIRFHQHSKLKKTHGWLIILASNEQAAIAFANRDVIKKVPGYAYHVEVKELCDVVEDKCKYVDGDFFPLSLAMYND